jgi:hypothetical protein
MFGYSPMMNFTPSIVRKQGFLPGIPPPPGGVQAYCPPIRGQFCPPQPSGPLPMAMVQAPRYSNTVEKHANWNVCYLCGFDVADGHISMTCPFHIQRPTHNVNFTRHNADHYINMGHPCSTKNQHKLMLPPM